MLAYFERAVIAIEPYSLFAPGRLIRPVNVETSSSKYDFITQAKYYTTLETD